MAIDIIARGMIEESSGDVGQLSEKVNSHTENSDIHVTTTDKSNWNGYASEIEQNKTDISNVKKNIQALCDVINGKTHSFVTDDTTAYSKSVPVGAKIASVNRVGGRTICFNQLTNADIISEGNEFYNLAFDDNGFVTITLVNPNITWARIRIAKNVKNHKLFVHFDFDLDISSYLSTYAESIDGQTQMIGNNKIGNNWYMVQPTLDLLSFNINDYWYTADSLNVRISTFDLTKMFGAGNEPSTVEEFEAMFPDDYYPYNEGTLMPSPITAFNSIIDGRILQTKEMPSAVLALEGYGDGINNDVYNYIDFETMTYHKCVGRDEETLSVYVLDEPVVTDISNMFPSDFNILDVMPTGKLVFENANKIAVPSEVEYIVDLAEVIA